ncbi:MAG: Kelch repeat-containing protein [Candidatus Aquicultorales bacterium]
MALAMSITLIPSVAYGAVVMHWATKAPMPAGMGGRAAGVYNGKIYLLGGSIWNGSQIVSAPNVDIYDPVNNVWGPAFQSLTVPRHGTANVQVGNVVYMFGGRNGTGSGSVMNTVVAYDMSTEVTTILPQPITQPKFAMRAVYVQVGGQDKVYLIGGQDQAGVVQDEIEEYNLTTGTTSVVTNLPYPVRHAIVFEHQGFVYIYGGDSSNNSTMLHDEGWIFNPSTGGYVQAPNNMPVQATGPVAQKLSNGKIYMAAGREDAGLGTQTTNEVREYDPVAMTWSIVGSLPTGGRVAMTEIAIVVNGQDRLYVFGGQVPGTPNSRVDTNEVGTLANATNSGNTTIPGPGTTTVNVGGTPYTVTMPAGTTSGELWVNTLTSLPQGMPSGFRLLGSFFDIATSSSFNGIITIRVPFNPSQVPGGGPVWTGNPNTAKPKLFHWNSVTNSWQNITTFVDTTNNWVEGQTTSLSPFALGFEESLLSSGVPSSSVWSLLGIAVLSLGALFLVYRRRVAHG